MSYFPMFVELGGVSCLVVGGGRVALHKVQVLKEFGARVTVVAERILPELKAQENVDCRERRFVPEDVKGRKLVVAATDDKALNRRISRLCKEAQIPVNAVDQIEDCSFIFPSYLKEKEVIAAFSSGGQSPAVTQYLKEQTRPVLTKLLGELAMQLGGLREQVKKRIPKQNRKAVYEAALQKGLEQQALLSEEEIQKMTGGEAICKE